MTFDFGTIVTAIATLAVAFATWRLVLTTESLAKTSATETAVLKDQLVEMRKSNAALTTPVLQVAGQDHPIFYKTNGAGLRPWVQIRLQNIAAPAFIGEPRVISGCEVVAFRPSGRIVTGGEYYFAVSLPMVGPGAAFDLRAAVALPVRPLAGQGGWSDETVAISVVGDGDTRPSVNATTLERLGEPVEKGLAEFGEDMSARYLAWRSKIGPGTTYSKMTEVIQDMPGVGPTPT